MSKAIERPHQTSASSREQGSLTDEELLVRFRDRGDRQAFTELVTRYERELFSYLKRYLGDAGMAEDAFQATFLQVHLKANQFEDGRAVRPWLYTIATNQAIDAQRRNKRHRNVSLDRAGRSEGDGELGPLVELLVSREVDPESHLDLSQQRDWIQQAVKDLPDQYRMPLDLVYYQGLKYREAADILGIPVGTVKSRLHSAILKLNEAFHQQFPSHSE